MVDPLVVVAAIQAAYVVLTGLWPIVHVRSFTAVTGSKTDLWLVKTVGALISVIGLVIASAAWRRAVSFEIAMLATVSNLVREESLGRSGIAPT